MQNYIQVSRLGEAEIRRIWARYDVDHSGHMSLAELHLLMQDLSELRYGHRHVSPEALRAQFSRIDLDGDGSIEWAEFFAAARQQGQWV